MLKHTVSGLLMTLAMGAFSATGLAGMHKSFMPENNLYLQDNLHGLANITQEQFNKIADDVVAVYQPAANKGGAVLSVNKLWSNGTVNAYADQSGNQWHVTMYGGLARRPEVTLDGFALVVCHELGHHFAGFPLYSAGEWAGSEGQSDYFATLACARKIWRDQTDVNATYRANVDSVAKEKCDAVWSVASDQDLCYRVAEAGFSLGSLLAALGGSGVPSFATPDPSQVSRTNVYHPAAQCRLDTYFQGALCTKNARFDFIPGKGQPNGDTTVAAEHESAANSCHSADGFVNGARPRCWFKPAL